jgi:hypothetical protein
MKGWIVLAALAIGCNGSAIGEGSSAVCSQPDGPSVEVPHDELVAHLIGQWQRCRGPGIFAESWGAHDGIELAADRSWHYLDRMPDGTLAAGGGGWFDASLWPVLMYFEDGNLGNMVPRFETNPRRLVSGGNGTPDSVYQLLP